MTTKQILKKHKLELIFNHAIYFRDLDDTAYGVLAEDTNYMIRNIEKTPIITAEEIEKNLSLLKDIVKSDNKK